MGGILVVVTGRAGKERKGKNMGWRGENGMREGKRSK